MATQWLEKFINGLKEVLDKPPYLIFVFIGSVLLIISIIYNSYFYEIWIFFLYSVCGSIWRYFEKDIDSGIKKIIKKEENKKISHLFIIIIYHIGNIGLFLALLYYSKLI